MLNLPLLTMSPFLTVPFSFSSNTYKLLWAYIEAALVEHTTLKLSDGNASMLTNNAAFQAKIHESAIGLELTNALAKYELGIPYYQLFIYKPNMSYSGIGNPHLDNLGKHTTCPMRFNLLLEGLPEHKLYWWPIDCNHELIEEAEFPLINNKVGWRQQVRGARLEDRLAAVGEPQVVAAHTSTPQKSGVFVRTDVVHAVEIAAVRRIVLSLRFNRPWAQLFK
jgi:hypothetical protein